MGFLDWLTGKRHSAKNDGGIRLMNPGRSSASVRISGARAYTPQVPAYRDCLIRLPAGKYSIRFELENEIETYQVDGVTVVHGTITPFTLTPTQKPGQRLRMVSGPV